jgi:hypothetical protein
MYIYKGLIVVIIFVNVFVFNTQASHASSPGQKLIEATYYRDEGPFVIVPSTVAAFAILPPAVAFGVGVGISGGIIGLPALPFMKSQKYLGSFIIIPAFFSAHLVSMPVTHAVGLPFYVLKKTFYDFPIWVSEKTGEVSG